jgi:hypothetical protein
MFSQPTMISTLAKTAAPEANQAILQFAAVANIAPNVLGTNAFKQMCAAIRATPFGWTPAHNREFGLKNGEPGRVLKEGVARADEFIKAKLAHSKTPGTGVCPNP